MCCIRSRGAPLRPLRLGFETANLYPSQGGVYTYSLELLRHLAMLRDAPHITFLDVLRYRNLATLQHDTPCLPWPDPPFNRACYEIARPVVPRSLSDRLSMLPGRFRALLRPIDSDLVPEIEYVLNLIPAVAARRFPSGTGLLDLCHWSDSALLRIPGVASVTTVYDTIPFKHPEWSTPAERRYFGRKLRAARHADRVLAISESTRRDVLACFPLRPERVRVVPLGVSSHFRQPLDRSAHVMVLDRYGLRARPYVFHLSNFKPHKNVPRLAQAFRSVLGAMPQSNALLVLAGTPAGRSVADLANIKASLGDRLRLPGPIPSADLPHLLAGARAVAVVSLYEGFGLPVLEAMACGTPVITSNRSSLPEVAGNAAVLVDPYDIRAMAHGLQRLLEDDRLCHDLAQRGRDRSLQFTWERTARLTMDVYREAIDARRKGGARCA